VTDPDTIYRLLPETYRRRDADSGYPLRTLCAVLSVHYAQLAAAVDAMYDDWFIETCAPTVIADLAELVGAQGLLTGTDVALDRAMVADALLLSARKGTRAALEQVAADTAPWPVRIIEAVDGLAATASARWPALPRHPLPDIHTAAPSDEWRSDALTRLSDVRPVDAPGARRSQGRPSSVLVYAWRLRADTTSGARAASLGHWRYTFDATGADVQLAIAPVARTPGVEAFADLDVPTPITRAAMAQHLPDYYGPGRSIDIAVDDDPIPASELLVTNLTHWRPHRHRHAAHRLCIDPLLGRILLPHRRYDAHAPVRVTYSRLITGGPGSSHSWPGAARGTHTPLRVRTDANDTGEFPSVGAALRHWTDQRGRGGADADLVVEIMDDAVYDDELDLDLYAGESLLLTAAAGRAPALAGHVERPLHIEIRGQDRVRPAASREAHQTGTDPLPTATISGITLHAAQVRIEGPLAGTSFDRCTLSPLPVDEDTGRRAPSIRVRSSTVRLSMRGCIVGPIAVTSELAADHDSDDYGGEYRGSSREPERARHHGPDTDPTKLDLADCIVDAAGPRERAIYGSDRGPATISLGAVRCTILGSITTKAVTTVADSLITGRLDATWRQAGLITHSYLAPASRTPRREQCLPQPTAPGQPVFDSTRFGTADYGRLSTVTPAAIITGARDGGELGAGHDRADAARLYRLNEHLPDFVPAGVDIAVRLAT
jgi:hypothetical protein